MSKDSHEVQIFMNLFSYIKNRCDDEPKTLIDNKTDIRFMASCDKLKTISDRISWLNILTKGAFSSPVSPEFLKMWSDYKARYEPYVPELLFGDAGVEYALRSDGRSFKIHSDWDKINSAAEEIVSIFVESFCDSQEVVDQYWFRHNWEVARSGVGYWEWLRDGVGLDLVGITRRRMLYRTVNLPQFSASKLSKVKFTESYERELSPNISEREFSPNISMFFNKLQQAMDAFVFGVPYAALALQRAIVEDILKKQFSADHRDLSVKLSQVKLPKNLKDSLYRLKNKADQILHEDFVDKSQKSIEMDILSNFRVIQDLIEIRNYP